MKVCSPAEVLTVLCFSGTQGEYKSMSVHCCPCATLSLAESAQLTAVVSFRVEKEVGGMEMAHEGMIWSLAWHPLGHILCSGSNDHTRYTHSHICMGTQQ